MNSSRDKYADMLKNTKAVSECLASAMSTLVGAFDRISSIYKEYGDYIRQQLSSAAESIKRALDGFKIPCISEEEKEKLRQSYEQWGKYGWTVIPDSPLYLFNSVPLNIEEANKKAEQYCKKANISSLFEEMQRKRINKKDLEEAIFCYENKQYKACALTLFGIVDSKLIRKMPKRKDEWRPVGGSAAKKLKETVLDGQERRFYEVLIMSNLFSCLSTVFASANDFKKEPPVINRNFLDHGMSRRKARKRDCIQLFLLLNNLVDCLVNSEE